MATTQLATGVALPARARLAPSPVEAIVRPEALPQADGARGGGWGLAVAALLGRVTSAFGLVDTAIEIEQELAGLPPSRQCDAARSRFFSS